MARREDFRGDGTRGWRGDRICWRRKRDSNPRASHPANGFQDRRLQPLGHSSEDNGSEFRGAARFGIRATPRCGPGTSWNRASAVWQELSRGQRAGRNERRKPAWGRVAHSAPRCGVEKCLYWAFGYTSTVCNFGSIERWKAAAIIRNCQATFASPRSFVLRMPRVCFIHPSAFSIRGRLLRLTSTVAPARAPVNGAFAGPVGVLCYVWADVDLPQRDYEVPRVIGCVRTHAHRPTIPAPSPVARLVVEHQQSGIAFGGSMGVRHQRVHHQAVAILHPYLAEIAEPGLLTVAFAVEPRIRVRFRFPRFIASTLVAYAAKDLQQHGPVAGARGRHRRRARSGVDAVELPGDGSQDLVYQLADGTQTVVLGNAFFQGNGAEHPGLLFARFSTSS